jgi:bifunctional DNA-binding transcriptional regulator/antitoxin component of YhaV-PrlF toxin-antitoxin module
VPAEVRRKLGLGPGSVLEWEEHGDALLVRRVGRYSIRDLQQTLFPEGAPRRPPAPVKEGVRRYIRRKHARD